MGFCQSVVIRSSRPEVFCEKVVLKIFAKFTGKHLCHSLFSATLLKKKAQAEVFSCEFCGIFKSTFFTEHVW